MFKSVLFAVSLSLLSAGAFASDGVIVKEPSEIAVKTPGVEKPVVFSTKYLKNGGALSENASITLQGVTYQKGIALQADIASSCGYTVLGELVNDLSVTVKTKSGELKTLSVKAPVTVVGSCGDSKTNPIFLGFVQK